MLKKSITIMLIFSFLIYTIGCSSYQEVLLITNADKNAVLSPDEETLSKSEQVKITTFNDSTYTLTKVKIQGLEFKGTEWISQSKFREVVISAEDIKKIETMQFDARSTLLTCAIIAAIPVVVIMIAFAGYEK